MVSSKAQTVDAYLKELSPERRAVVEALVALVRRHLPKGYAEAMTWGMPGWELPLAAYPDTYNKKPLSYVGLAAQKNHYALYLNMAYMDSNVPRAIESAYAKAGKKLDMGGCCLRFKKLDDLHLEAVAAAIASTGPKAFIAQYEKGRSKNKPTTKNTKNTKTNMEF